MVNHSKRDRCFNWIVNGIMFLYAFITLVPLIYVLANSFSSADAVNRGLVGLLPVHFSVEGYAKVFQDKMIFIGYRNTILYTVVGTLLQLALQFTAAYALSRKDFYGRTFFSMYLVLTMFLQGGMIPTFIVVKALNLYNNFFSMIIPGCVNVFYIIIIRTYIQSAISYELQEAAMIDGCSNTGIFLKIVLPLCKPVLAVMTLYAIVGYWNSYFNSLLYLNNENLYPLQRILQRILISSEATLGGGVGSNDSVMAELLKYVTIVAASAPVLLIYPFFERFFEKGLMVGGVKG